MNNIRRLFALLTALHERGEEWAGRIQPRIDYGVRLLVYIAVAVLGLDALMSAIGWDTGILLVFLVTATIITWWWWTRVRNLFYLTEFAIGLGIIRPGQSVPDAVKEVYRLYAKVHLDVLLVVGLGTLLFYALPLTVVFPVIGLLAIVWVIQMKREKSSASVLTMAYVLAIALIAVTVGSIFLGHGWVKKIANAEEVCFEYTPRWNATTGKNGEQAESWEQYLGELETGKYKFVSIDGEYHQCWASDGKCVLWPAKGLWHRMDARNVPFQRRPFGEIVLRANGTRYVEDKFSVKKTTKIYAEKNVNRNPAGHQDGPSTARVCLTQYPL